MNPLERIKDLMNSIGAISEVMKMWYDAFQGQGFNKNQALYLTGKALAAMLGTTNDRDRLRLVRNVSGERTM